MNEGRGCVLKRGNSRVAEVPAETALCEGQQVVKGQSQSDPVDVSPRLGTEKGVEVIRHAVGMGDPGRAKSSLRERPEKLEL